MATYAHMSNPHSNKKIGNLASDCFTDGVVDHEMHLKMSKKIAQLTKVIYALNTKNDEHEQIVKVLQQQHDKEKHQFMSEMNSKLEALRNKLVIEADLRKKIASLEASTEEYEKQRKNLLHDFEEFKSSCADQEMHLKAEHHQKMSGLSKELQLCQKEFASKINNFETLIAAFEREKEESIMDLRKAHQLEVDNLLKTQRSQTSHVSSELEAIKAKYSEELTQAKEALSLLKSDKAEMENDYEEKLKKAKALYEKELELLRKDQSQTFNEQQHLLQERLDKLTKDFQFQEVQYRKRIEGLLSDQAETESTITDLRSELSALSLKHGSTSDEVNNLLTQLKTARIEAEDFHSKYQGCHRELQVVQERCEDQSKQLIHKSGVIGELTASEAQYRSTIQKLEENIAEISRQLKILQDEKKLLLTKSSSESEQKSRDVQLLEQALEDLRIDKQTQKDKYEADIQSLERLLKEEKERSDRELSETNQRLTSQHESALQKLQSEEETRRKSIEERWKDTLQTEVSILQMSKEETRKRLEQDITNLTAKLNTAEDELDNLKKQYGDTSQNLGAAASELADLRSKVSSLQQQLNKSTSDFQTESAKVKLLEDELEHLRTSNRQMAKDHETELKTKLDDLNKSLEATWLEKLRQEVARLKQELEKQFINDRASTIQHLTDKKNEELERLNRDSEAKIRQLVSKINELERALRDEKVSEQTKLQEIQLKYEQKLADLNKQIELMANDYGRKIEKLKIDLEVEWTEKMEKKSHELEDRLVEVKNKHIQDMSAQMTAHKAAIDMITREAEAAKYQELKDQQTNFLREKEQLSSEMQKRHHQEMETNNQSFVKQITALRMELQRAVDLRMQKETELNHAKEDMNDKLQHRERSIKTLELSIQKLEETIKQLNREIERKGEEILNIRSDATRQIKKKEEALVQQHAEEMEQITANHAEETQQILAEFTKAQNILKDKITELSEMLEEAEDRYRNREPRQEDIAMIEHLKKALAEKELEMQQLLAEKQFYQMELVNRETNFTKVFAGTGKSAAHQMPQVGFINPLAKKKKGEKGPTKYAVNADSIHGVTNGGSSSAGSNNSHRLRPIAGSPIHDERLNPNNVLPPPAFTKKFVQ